MNSTVLLIGMAVPVIGLIVFLVVRRRGTPPRLQKQSNAMSRSRIGVKFVAEQAAACNAAQRADGHVFACDKAPQLPLPGCKQRKCKCQLQAVQNQRRLSRRGPRSPANNEAPPDKAHSIRGRRREDRLWHDVS